MSTVVSTIISTIGLFLLGILIRKSELLDHTDADILIRVAFYIALPAIVLETIPQVNITIEFFILPFIGSITILSSFIISKAIVQFFKLSKDSEGVFVIGSMILNLGFNVPFVLAAFGDEGFARASFIDIGNIFITLSLTYYVAQTYGRSTDEGSDNISFINKKLLLSPPLLALVVAITLNFAKFKFDQIIFDFLDILGGLLVPLLMISVGLYFNPTFDKIIPAFSVVFIRMGFGLIIGFIFVFLLGVDDLTSKIIIISLAAPVGFNTLTFAVLENLDKRFAANILSLAIPLGIISNSMLILIL